MAWQTPGIPFFNSGIMPISGGDNRLGFVDSMNVNRSFTNMSRPGKKMFQGAGPDSTRADYGARIPRGATAVPDVGNVSYINGMFELALGGGKASEAGAKGMETRVQNTKTFNISPKGYACDYVPGMPLFTKHNIDSALSDKTLVVWTAAEMNRWLVQWSHLFRTASELTQHLSVLGILNNHDNTITDMFQINGGVQAPIIQANTMISGEIRTLNHFGMVAPYETLYAVWTLKPRPASFNFTVAANTEQRVNFAFNGLLSDHDSLDVHDRFELHEEEDDKVARTEYDALVATSDLNDVRFRELRDSKLQVDLARDDRNGGWRDYVWQVGFKSSPYNTLSEDECSSVVQVVVKDKDGTPTLVQKKILGAYQRIGKARYTLVNETGVRLGADKADAACRDHHVASRLPGVTIDVAVAPAVSFESNILDLH